MNTEMETALERQLSDGSVRIIPVRLDDTELPRLLRRLKWIQAERDRIDVVARTITDLDSYADFIKAIRLFASKLGAGEKAGATHRQELSG